MLSSTLRALCFCPPLLLLSGEEAKPRLGRYPWDNLGWWSFFWCVATERNVQRKRSTYCSKLISAMQTYHSCCNYRAGACLLSRKETGQGCEVNFYLISLWFWFDDILFDFDLMIFYLILILTWKLIWNWTELHSFCTSIVWGVCVEYAVVPISSARITGIIRVRVVWNRNWASCSSGLRYVGVAPAHLANPQFDRTRATLLLLVCGRSLLLAVEAC